MPGTTLHPPHILVNACSATPRPRGMGVVIRNLLGVLMKDRRFRFILASNGGLDPELTALAALTGTTIRTFRSPLPFFEQVILPVLIARVRPDLCWFPSNTFPLWKPAGTRYLVTVNDAIFMNPRFQPTRLVQKIGKTYRRWVLGIGWRSIDRMTGISRCALEEIRRYFPAPTGLGDPIVYPSFTPIRPDPGALQELGLRKGGYFYTVTGSLPSKNAGLLMKAFGMHAAREAGTQLVVSGVPDAGDRWRLLEQVGDVSVRSRVIMTSYVSDAVKAALMAGARAFVFPSMSEGFGIPVVEALYYSRRIFASDIPVLREVGGRFARYFDPTDVGALADLMNRPLPTVPFTERRAFVRKRYSVEAAARRMAAILIDASKTGSGVFLREGNRSRS